MSAKAEYKVQKKLQQIAHDNSIQKRLEWLWKLLIIIAISSASFIIPYVYQFQVSHLFRDVSKGNPIKLIILGITVSIFYMLFDRVMHELLDQRVEQNYLSLKYQGQEIRKKRSITMVKYLIAIIYYAFTSTFSILMLFDSNVIPKWMGGRGQCINLYIHLPIEPNANIYIEILYTISLGKHFGRFFLHTFIASEGNFYSYFLHHLISILLILCSYSINAWMVGVLILALHDASDLFNSIVRFYMQYKNTSKIIMSIFYVTFPIIWIGTRNVLYPLCCIAPLYDIFSDKILTLSKEQLDIFLVPTAFCAVLLVFLEILHIIWTLGLLSYIYTKLKGKAKTS